MTARTSARLRREIEHAAAALTEAGVDSPRADAEELAAYAADTSRGRLSLIEEVDDDLLSPVRRSDRSSRAPNPVAAHRRYRSARSGDRAVGPGVFIPRPETEGLLEWASAQPLPPHPCSSTCARARVRWRWPCRSSGLMRASSPSTTATRRSATRAETSPASPVELVRADVTDTALLPELDGQVDLLVANPPYIPDGVALEPEVANMIRRMHCSAARTGWTSSKRSSSWLPDG